MGFDHKSVRDGDSSLADESLRSITRQRSYSLYFVIGLAVLVGGWFAFQAWQARQIDADDKLMLERAETIRHAIEMYHLENAEYPVSLDQVGQYLPTDGLWPKNPYDRRKIQDAGTEEFDPATTVGMVHYERVEESGRTGYALHVFGRSAKLDVLWGGYYVEE